MPRVITTPGAQFAAASGNQYVADASGNILVPVGADLRDLLNSGCVFPSQPGVNFRNVLDGGDFSINPWQRNLTALGSAGVIASAISSTVTYFPDRWFAVGGASSSILLSRIADATLSGFAAHCKLQRSAANANTAPIYFGQVMETADSTRLQNQLVTLSFYAKQGANFSGASLTVQLTAGLGTDQSAANLVAGAWTTQSYVINTTQVLTTGWTRYQFSGYVPAGATQLGVLFSFIPVGTAGSDDSITFNGIQLETGGSAGAVERRDVQVELEICQRYAFALAEPAASVVVATGSVSASNTEIFYYSLPVQMRNAPTVTTAAGSFKVNSSTAGVVAATGLTGNATHTPNVIGLTSTGTGTAGQSALLQGGGGAGYILASSDY